MKTIGIVAHVDSGKTTLSEAILHHCGVLRTPGRVDHKNTLLDHDPTERQRGITIYTDQAHFSHDGQDYAILDTPGHTDFAPEMERALSVLDAAVLVISAPAGIQAHTAALWRLLRKSKIPTVLFLNKCDAPGVDTASVLRKFTGSFGAVTADLKAGMTEDIREQLALLDEVVLEQYLAGTVTDALLCGAAETAMREGTFCPAVCGSALHEEGIGQLLDVLNRFVTAEYDPAAALAARCYAVRHDGKGNRVAMVKVLSGTLMPRQVIGEEKITQLHRCIGSRLEPIPAAPAGSLCAVSGLRQCMPGDMLGESAEKAKFTLQPLLRAQVSSPTLPPEQLLEHLRMLESEEPTLQVQWQPQVRQINVCLMGRIQMEILTEVLKRRFGLDVTFSPPEILYRETVAKSCLGSGHYEPLRHYAEVRLLLSPGKRGSGVVFKSICHTDDLLPVWQRLIKTHVLEKQHPGVLTGAPLTDVEITLLAGRAHLKHTEGGDFREATYRAIRHGLFCGQSVLLEPYYRIKVRVETALAGRILTELQSRGCVCQAPLADDRGSTVNGRGPVRTLLTYAEDFAALTRGKGELFLEFDGYEPCSDAEQVIRHLGYDREADAEHPAGSVFCDHGAGHYVPWQEAEGMMHCDLRDVLKGVSL